MLTPTLAVGSLLTLLEGTTYLVVGRQLHKTKPGAPPFAWRLFVAWWILIGVNKILAAGAGLGAASGIVSFPAYMTVINVNLILLPASLFCLMSYLVYLFTGRQARLWVVALVYATYWFALQWSLLVARPVSVGIGSWRTFIVNAGASPPLVQLFNLTMLFLPQTVGALLYLRLRSRLTTSTQRYRVILVPTSIILWSLSITLVALPGFSESATMQVGSRLVGALAGVTSLLAYHPPEWVRRRYGIGMGVAAVA